MAWTLDFDGTGNGTSGSISAIESIGDGICLKMRIEGQMILDVTADMTAVLLHIGDGSITAEKVTIALDRDTSNQWRLRAFVDGGQVAQTAYSADANLTGSTFYVVFFYHDDGATPNGTILKLFEDDGTEKATGGNVTAQAPPTGAGTGIVMFGYGPTDGDRDYDGGAVGKIDGIAIYSAVLTGADRYSEPSSSDSDIAAYWSLTEGASTPTVDHVGAEDADLTGHAWVEDGLWEELGAAADQSVLRVALRNV